MARANDRVAELLQEYADLLSITGGDAFKTRAYEKAAQAVAGHHEDVAALGVPGLRAIPHVGASIASKIREYLDTGSVRAVEEARARVPAGVRALTEIPTLGPRKAMQLYSELGIGSVDELAHAIDTERLRGLKGFGDKTEENLLHGIQLLRQASGRAYLDVALNSAEEIVAELAAVTGCRRCAYAGSLRRMRETIGDIDVLASATKPGPLMTAFTNLPSVTDVIARGDTKSSVRTTSGLQVDLRVVRPVAWGAALQYFTGSKAHNIRTRAIAVRQGLKLSEYGLFDAESGELVVSETEREVYERLGMQWVPPPLREDRGEIEAARGGELPELVAEKDLRGDLHTHTDLTDGVSTLDQMVAEATRRGYEYYAITDHAPNLVMQRMSVEKALQQRAAIGELQRSRPGIQLLHGTELNIDPDGEVDWPGDFLEGFDVCVAAVHSHFRQPAADMTRRLVRACENPNVNIIGHPTARRIGKRDPIDADFDEVFRACARTGTALEIDSLPDRLDLRDEHILRAKRHGVRFAIDSDSHATVHLAGIRYGVATAQRGWLTPEDVINTWPLPRLRAFLRKNQ